MHAMVSGYDGCANVWVYGRESVSLRYSYDYMYRQIEHMYLHMDLKRLD